MFQALAKAFQTRGSFFLIGLQIIGFLHVSSTCSLVLDSAALDVLPEMYGQYLLGAMVRPFQPNL